MTIPSPCIIGRDRDAKIDLRSADRQLDAAILRKPPLGDVEPSHDLDARHDRGSESAGWRLDLAQSAVDAIADAKVILERLDVDV